MVRYALKISQRSEFTISGKLPKIISYPVDTGSKLKVHKSFRRNSRRPPNVLCTFNSRPMSAGYRWVARTPTNIKDREVCSNSKPLKEVNCCYKHSILDV